ncbi:YIP1 family protein [Streptomyces sp. MUM 203J]|uniref:Yip1 family protein n=1 Tax=Streptomyces sp. MUM 203J TaxID=2791990 RepID=UPI001F03C791|nr:Yip1 family protein [Streptomyces sp. MUM 203J]MCH0540890.1 YIP1 family protein [Streptomyces sp. MUM 203J]
MAGFRIGRGRDNRTPQQHPQQQAPYGSAAAPPSPHAPQQQWPQGGGGRAYEEPEYFGDPHGAPHAPHRPQPHPQHQQPYGSAPRGGADPYAANNPGHTQVFSVDDSPYGPEGGPGGPDSPAAPTGPRLPWKQLLSGIVRRPGQTFWQMRDHAVWGPALVVTFVYGLLALFGFDKARDEAINATISTAIPYVLVTAVMMIVGGLILGMVTHTLARQLGGNGSWQPTVGLSMLIMSMTDAPRLLFAVFLGGENSVVQVIGWLSWLAAGALFTSMVSKSHDLPWPKALGASSIQLVALLSLIKLGTL